MLSETADFLRLLREQTERMSQMTKTLLEMSELRMVPCNDRIDPVVKFKMVLIQHLYGLPSLRKNQNERSIQVVFEVFDE